MYLHLLKSYIIFESPTANEKNYIPQKKKKFQPYRSGLIFIVHW